MSEYLLLNSGGLDSAMMIAKYAADGVNLHSVFLNTRQLNEAGIKAAAQETANRYCQTHKELVFDLGQTSDFWYDTNTGQFTMHDVSTPEQRTGFHGVCPCHFALAATAGMAYASVLGIGVVYSALRGVVDEDFPALVHGAIDAPRLSVWRPHLETPILSIASYADVASWAGVDILDFDYTVSCRMETPCGVCDKCLDRQEVGLT